MFIHKRQTLEFCGVSFGAWTGVSEVKQLPKPSFRPAHAPLWSLSAIIREGRRGRAHSESIKLRSGESSVAHAGFFFSFLTRLRSVLPSCVAATAADTSRAAEDGGPQDSFQSIGDFRLSGSPCFPARRRPVCSSALLIPICPSVNSHPTRRRPRDCCPNKTLHSRRPLDGGRPLTIRSVP